MAEGYVYLLKSETGHWKIGRTKNPDDRRRTFNVKLPFKVEYEHLIKCDDAHKVETTLHDYYRMKRRGGEWFNLADDDVELIKQMQSDADCYALLKEARAKMWRDLDEKARIWREQKALNNPDAIWDVYWRGVKRQVKTCNLEQYRLIRDELYPIDSVSSWYNDPNAD